MDEQSPAAEPATFNGQMLLYDQPELLSRERHGDLGLSVTNKPFEFASKTRSVPIVLSEIVTAQKILSSRIYIIGETGSCHSSRRARQRQ